jgi:hypothetical protein
MNSENQGRKRQNLAGALYKPWTKNKIRAEESMPNKIRPNTQRMNRCSKKTPEQGPRELTRKTHSWARRSRQATKISTGIE